jgi:hypothetical protein
MTDASGIKREKVENVPGLGIFSKYQVRRSFTTPIKASLTNTCIKINNMGKWHTQKYRILDQFVVFFAPKLFELISRPNEFLPD